MSPLTRRISLRFAALVIATTTLVLVAGGWLLQREMLRSMEAAHAVEFAELIAVLHRYPESRAKELADHIDAQLGADAALYYIQIHDDAGVILFRSDNLDNRLLPDLSSENQAQLFVPEIGSLHLSEFHQNGWHVQIASPLKPVSRILRNYARVSGLLLLGTMVLSLFMGYLFSRFVLRPVRVIEQTARRIRADNLRDRIPVPAVRDELSDLALLLNQMFDRLERSFEEVKRFTADASHELKTPLALIRLNAEKLRPRLVDDAEAASSLDDLIEEITRLNQIIESMLFLSKAEAGVLTLMLKSQPVSAVIEPFAEDAAVLSADRGVRFVLARNDVGEAPIEANLLRQLLLNLVGNAITVSPRGSALTLESAALASGWRFTVTDEGPGLPPEQLAKVFGRFVRYNHATGNNHGSGHGLGLAICRGIAELHRGTIRAENRTDGQRGLRVIVDIPR